MLPTQNVNAQQQQQTNGQKALRNIRPSEEKWLYK